MITLTQILAQMKFPPFRRPDPSDRSHLPEEHYFVRWLVHIFILYLGVQASGLIAAFLGPPWCPWWGLMVWSMRTLHFLRTSSFLSFSLGLLRVYLRFPQVFLKFSSSFPEVSTYLVWGSLFEGVCYIYIYILYLFRHILEELLLRNICRCTSLWGRQP